MVAHQVLEGQPTFSFSNEKSTASISILIWPGDLLQLLTELFPPPFVGPDGELIYPLGDPLPNFGFLYPESCKISPFPSDKVHAVFASSADAAAPYLKATVGYRTREQGDDDDAQTLVSHTYDVGGEFLTIPSSGLAWLSYPTKAVQNEDIQAGRIVPQVEHQISWDKVPSVPIGAIRSCIGCVNSGGFFGAAAESLLFVGAQIARDVLSDGTVTFKVDYKFSERVLNMGGQAVGWNHFFRPDKGYWERLVTLQGNYTIYQGANFNALFTSN